jgi:uncharacterized protein YjbI with pentapeptide repeats
MRENMKQAKTYFDDRDFRNDDLLQQNLNNCEFDQCRFIGCDLSERDFSNSTLIDCDL